MAEDKQTKKTNLGWDNDAMTWRDEDGNAVDHPRYKDSPRSLEGKSFIKGYLRSVQDGDSLNDYMKTHGKFKAADVTKAAKKFRALYELANPGMTFSLLTKKKLKVDAGKKADTKAVVDSIAELMKDGPAITRKKKTRKPKKS